MLRTFVTKLFRIIWRMWKPLVLREGSSQVFAVELKRAVDRKDFRRVKALLPRKEVLRIVKQSQLEWTATLCNLTRKC